VSPKKSQSFAELLQQLYAYEDADRRSQEHLKNLLTMQRCSFIEKYIKGDFSVLLDVPSNLKRNVKWWRLRSTPSTTSVDVASLIFQFHSLNRRDVNERYEKPMFVKDVQLVNGPNGVIPSTVRLYAAHHQLEQSEIGDVYFSIPKRSFQKLIRRVDGKLLFLGVKRGGCEFFEGSQPSIIEGGFQVVDSVPDYQGELIVDCMIAKVVFDDLVSNLRIDLGRGHIGLSQSGKCGLEIHDVLIGPVDL
jgi:hypothetical protein